eukprot:s4695_g3.t1
MAWGLPNCLNFRSDCFKSFGSSKFWLWNNRDPQASCFDCGPCWPCWLQATASREPKRLRERPRRLWTVSVMETGPRWLNLPRSTSSKRR